MRQTDLTLCAKQATTMTKRAIDEINAMPELVGLIQSHCEFAPGVPANDETCQAILDNIAGGIFLLGTDWPLEIHSRKHRGKTIMVCYVRRKHELRGVVHREFSADASGLRELIAWAKHTLKDLRTRGPCPACPTFIRLRLPTAEFCAQCCFVKALT